MSEACLGLLFLLLLLLLLIMVVVVVVFPRWSSRDIVASCFVLPCLVLSLRVVLVAVRQFHPCLVPP